MSSTDTPLALWRSTYKLWPGDIEQHLYTLRGIGFPVSKLASEGYVIFHNRFQYGRI